MGYTVHGLRLSFTDWAAQNDYPQELREMALAHAVGLSSKLTVTSLGSVSDGR
jgi:hypothetical protein